MRYIRFIIAILVMLFVLILIVENHTALSTKVIFRFHIFTYNAQTPEISLYFIVAISFLFGVLITGLYGMVERFRLKRQLRQMNKQLKEKEKELNSLRNLPVTSEETVSAGDNSS